MIEGVIQTACSEGVRHIRLRGDLRFRLGPRFEAFVRGFFLADACEDIVIDLNEVVHIDSTMLGLLARIARYAHARGLRRPEVLSSHDDINLLLETMGFSEVFKVVNAPSPEIEGLEDIPEGGEEEEDLPDAILEAHRSLMALSPQTAARFGEAVAYLEREMTSTGRPSGDAEPNPDAAP